MSKENLKLTKNTMLVKVYYYPYTLKGQPFRQYCCSFYRAPLWYLKSDGVEAICVAWQNALQTIYKVHPATHFDIITALSGQVPLLSNLKAKFGEFFKMCRVGKNMTVKAAVTAALVNPMSCAGRNYREVLNAFYEKKII